MSIMFLSQWGSALSTVPKHSPWLQKHSVSVLNHIWLHTHDCVIFHVLSSFLKNLQLVLAGLGKCFEERVMGCFYWRVITASIIFFTVKKSCAFFLWPSLPHLYFIFPSRLWQSRRWWSWRWRSWRWWSWRRWVLSLELVKFNFTAG